jgi:hypothetical protein
MTKSMTRNLYLVGLILGFIGGFLLFVGLQDSAYVMHGTTTTFKSVGHPGFVIASSIVLGLAVILGFVAWLGALIQTAQLHRWGWFFCLLLFAGITLLLYIFWGPTTYSHPPLPIATPPHGDFGD